jgi:hypothetical protein
MKLLKFATYADYVNTQTAANRHKLANVWVSDKELRCLAAYIKRHMPQAAFGLCHGVRNGYEVHTLRELLGIEVLGTDIADTATEFAHVIQWDFHDVKDAWLGKVDFIYSNAWDHSYAPEAMLDAWMRCLAPQGRCFLHWTRYHTDKYVGGGDCFGASFTEIQALVRQKFHLDTMLTVREWVRQGSTVRQVRNFFRKFRIGRTIYILVITQAP